MEHFQCIYYNPIAQEDQVVNIDAENLKSAYLIAYLYLDKKYDFYDIHLHHRYDNAITMDDIKKQPTGEDFAKLNKFFVDEQLEDD